MAFDTHGSIMHSINSFNLMSLPNTNVVYYLHKSLVIASYMILHTFGSFISLIKPLSPHYSRATGAFLHEHWHRTPTILNLFLFDIWQFFIKYPHICRDHIPYIYSLCFPTKARRCRLFHTFELTTIWVFFRIISISVIYWIDNYHIYYYWMKFPAIDNRCKIAFKWPFLHVKLRLFNKTKCFKNYKHIYCINISQLTALISLDMFIFMSLWLFSMLSDWYYLCVYNICMFILKPCPSPHK